MMLAPLTGFSSRLQMVLAWIFLPWSLNRLSELGAFQVERWGNISKYP